MTLGELIAKMKILKSGSSLVFTANGEEIAGGYHLTEFKLSRVSSIDCGARTSAWVEATMQLLDGAGGEHMRLDKFLAIAEKSASIVEDLGAAELGVEFAPENQGIQIFDLGEPVQLDDTVTVPLIPRRASCKPALDFARANTSSATQTSCCGPAQTSCCG